MQMNLAQTFQTVEETRFLKRLSLEERLLFIGEAQPLGYIQDFLSQAKPIDSNYYLSIATDNLDALQTNLPTWHHYQAIIIVSWQQEDWLWSEIKQRLASGSVSLPIVRLFADVFINLMCNRQLFQHTSDILIRPKISYAIMTTPRSGSTHFCELLDSTNIAGYPMEHLRFATQELAINCNFDYIRFLYNLMQYQITSNQVFGTKFISHFLFELKKTKFEFKQIFKAIDKFILLIRKDKVAQAVSLVIAQKTNIWHIRNNINSSNSSYQDYNSQLKNIAIDDSLMAEIDQKQKFINHQEKQLQKMLENHQKNFLTIYYEDIVANPHAEVNRVLNFLEIDLPQGFNLQLNSKIAKMSASISQEIIRQYRQQQSQFK